MDELHLTITFVSAPDKETARRLAKLIAGHRLATCVQILSGVESFYWWEGELEDTDEFLLVIKTEAALVPRLEALVLEHHPYKVPEIISFPASTGQAPYLDWMRDELAHPTNKP